MLLTEEEANTKWCPHSCIGESDGSTSNRWFNNPIPSPCRCIASDCMAWRERILGTCDTNGVEYPYHPGNPLPDGWTVKKRGFCGLAGEPHA